MFTRRPHELTAEDIAAVIRDTWQEGAEIEFKETLPSKKGAPDPWIQGSGSIGDKARNEILEEIIAFANAHGGHLILGIQESAARPARAVAVNPIPRCTELADRLKLQCRDCIEPQVPLIEAAGVPMSDDECGVVVIRVPQSRLAPHRHMVTRECYARRNDRSEKMTMREIQDLTLLVERGLATIEHTFEESRIAAQRWIDKSKSVESHERLVFMRSTLLPLVPLYINRVHGNGALLLGDRTFGYTTNGTKHTIDGWPGVAQWQPILRGTRNTDVDEDYKFVREIHCDGRIEHLILQKLDTNLNGPSMGLRPTEFLSLVCNSICSAELFRCTAGAPEVEYGMEIEMDIIGGDLRICQYGSVGYSMRFPGTLPMGTTLFPRYSLGAPNEFPALARFQ